ncbi:DUF1762-domain-containing protein [Suhomyces tanzawaensis NRRL Y-17324]|uniref:DUF1762-domain-containing protein n=1 Tax=Suhomyces tanzawaensis NRRL Y-17324 TaxID=984487 RepID=A0A1E4SRZ0_9ASCO|nr:DUF1762-domain-containing protein [Suhomyces tanzawaensis NRRL Y-17324]ODV82274.1 DUF1762-domain-containing protein [Suhomyces tanzawaensis NRRL Y-17324]
MDQPPQILRIKRKRTQDPLQALILEGRDPKRSKPSTPIASRYTSPVHTPRPPSPNEVAKRFYKLSRTDALTTGEEQSVIDSVLRVAGGEEDDDSSAPVRKSRKRKFIIPQNQSQEDAEIPNELSDMVNSYLNVNEDENGSRRKKRIRNKVPENEGSEPSGVQEDSDYVYDVYLLSNNEPMTTANHPQAQIGYIRFFDDEDLLYVSDEEDNKPVVLSDDEDSNAEDFYQNDYPSDEDAGVYSDSHEIVDDEAELANELNEDDYDYDYEGSYLAEDNFDDTDFKRNKFFESDEHDPMAIHRDRIFGKLEKMINES